MTTEEIIDKYSFPIEERSVNKLHPVYSKWLPVCWIIEDIYGAVENGSISLGKARELTSAVIEEYIKNFPEKKESPNDKK